MNTVLFTDKYVSVVSREDYLAMAQLNSSGMSNTCRRTVSVLQVHERCEQ